MQKQKQMFFSCYNTVSVSFCRYAMNVYMYVHLHILYLNGSNVDYHYYLPAHLLLFIQLMFQRLGASEKVEKNDYNWKNEQHYK